MKLLRCTLSYAEKRSANYQSVEVRESVEVEMDEPWEWTEEVQDVRTELIWRVRETAAEAVAPYQEASK